MTLDPPYPATVSFPNVRKADSYQTVTEESARRAGMVWNVRGDTMLARSLSALLPMPHHTIESPRCKLSERLSHFLFLGFCSSSLAIQTKEDTLGNQGNQAMRLLTKPGGNAKLAKGNGDNFAPYILHLAPFTSSGSGLNTCPNASPECISLCLNTAGRAIIYPAILASRSTKTKLLASDRPRFLAMLRREIANGIKNQAKKGKEAVFRLNGTSDIDFSEVIASFPNVRFYDYTKDPIRFNRFLLGLLPPNYHLTFSFSGRNGDLCRSFLARGGNVAIAFARPIGAKYVQPRSWFGFPTVNGDESDLRFLDSPGSVIALKAKGRARKAIHNPFIVGS